MRHVPDSVVTLIDELKKLPGVGPRSAERITYHLLRANEEDVVSLGKALISLKQGLTVCKVCFNISEDTTCNICSSKERSKYQIMVVEDPLDVIAIEKTRRYDGVYHVLGGVIDPIRGIGTKELRVSELLTRLHALILSGVDTVEVIIATNPSTEGETTAVVLRKVLREEYSENQLSITRIARGLPVGGDLDYADPITLLRSLEGRVEY